MLSNDLELGQALFRKPRDVVREGFGGTLPPVQVAAEAVTDSEDGSFIAMVDADLFAADDLVQDADIDMPDGYALLEVPTSASVKAGDSVIVTVQGNKAIDTGNIGWGDRVGTAVSAAETLAQEAQQAAASAQQGATDAASLAAAASSAASSAQSTADDVAATIPTLATKDELATIASDTGTTVITTPAATAPLVSLDVDGKSVQNGTPTPSAPVEIESVAGANLASVPSLTYNAGITAVCDLGGDVTFDSVIFAFEADNLAFTNTGGAVLDFRTDGGGHNYVAAGTMFNPVAVNSTVDGLVYVRKTSITFRYVYVYATTNYARFTSGSFNNIQVISGNHLTPFVEHGCIGIWPHGRNLIRARAKTGTNTNYYNEMVASSGLLAPFELQEGVTYTLSADVASTADNFYIGVGAGNGAFSKSIAASNNNLTSGRVSLTFTPTADQLASGNILAFRAPAYLAPTTYTYSVSNIQLERGDTATAYEPYQGTTTPIDLQGHQLRSLPNGTKDELHVDSAGNVTLVQHCEETNQAVTDGVTGTVGVDVLSSTGQIANGAQVVYALASPQTVSLGTVTMPTVADGDTVEVVGSSVVPTIGASWLTETGGKAADAAEAALVETIESARKTEAHFWTDSGGAHVGTVDGQAHASGAGYNMTLGATGTTTGILLDHDAETLASFTPSALNFYADGQVAAGYTKEGVSLYAQDANDVAQQVAAFTDSGVTFFDGTGNAAANILASFGVSGAHVGRLTEPHIIIGNDGFSTYDDQNRLVSHIDSLGWWRYKPVDEYPDGDTSKPANPDYDPDHPSVLESFIGTDSEGLAYIFDKVVFGDWRARNVYDDVHDLWWPTPGRDVTFDVRSMEDSVLRLTATQYHEGQEPAPHGAEIEITSDGYINIAGSVSLGNSNVIYSKTAGGDIRQVMQINASNQLVVGYGGYNSQDVDTYVEGNNVTLTSRGAINMRSGSNALVNYAPTDWVYLVGSSSGNRVRYCKRGGAVFVEVWYESSAGLSTTAKTLGTLPAGFRPDVQVETAAFGNVDHLVMLRVNPGGAIVAKVMSGTTNYVKGVISFPV